MNKKDRTLRALRISAIRLGANVAKIIDVKDLAFDPRSQFMCMSCRRYGKKATCPPFIPETSYFETLISHYHFGIFLAVKRRVKNTKAKEIDDELSVALHRILIKLEKEAFEMGCYFAVSFIGGSCKWCLFEPSAQAQSEMCEAPCEDPIHGRIPMEAMGIDVVKTSKKLGIEVRFPVERQFWRIGMLLVK